MTPLITSTANERIKRIRSLRIRKTRDETGLAFVEGIRSVVEAVQVEAPLDALISCPKLVRGDAAWAAIATARSRDVEVIEVDETVFRTLSKRDGPQGIAATVRQRWERLDEIDPAPGETWVALESAADAGNIGTIIRTCDATGAAGVILLDHTADPYDPVAMRASTGAVFTTRLVRASFEVFKEWARLREMTVVGTSGAGSEDYRTADYGERTVVLMGSERAGLPDAYHSACDELVSIPMRGRADSLNLAVATALVLYEVLHQREGTRG
ncbi:MAG: RNA methyltransferase [Chloroflexi bacterium]|nr:RNA methyltransferase [Chloroflexota bacterium]MQC48291.1 RNA methyltransferase [Chloroflexota bacterium]